MCDEDVWGEDPFEMDEIARLIVAALSESGSRREPLSERAKREMDALLVGSGYDPVYYPDDVPAECDASRVRRGKARERPI